MSKNIKKNYKRTESKNLNMCFIGKNPITTFNKKQFYPKIDESVVISPFSTVIGDITIEENVFIGCNVVLRADEGTPFYIGNNTNIQDGVIFHGIKDVKCSVNEEIYSIYVGNNVSIAHGALIHGPVIIGNNTFVGFNAMVFNAIIKDECYIDAGAIITGNIKIDKNKYVPIGAIIDTQDKADLLLEVSKEEIDFANKVVNVNNEFSKNYNFTCKCSCGIGYNDDDLISD